MSNVVRPDKSINQPSPAEEHPEFTIPQGTQAYAVEHGHEDRDVDIGNLLSWFGGLMGGLILSILLMRAFFFAIIGHENEEKGQIPSPLFAQRVEPPLPHLLPIPPDTNRRPPQDEVKRPWDIHAEEVQGDDLKLQQYGLFNPENQQEIIPDAAAAAAEKDGTPGVAAPVDPVTGQMKEDAPAEAGGTAPKEK
jgi:hypothetical protein